MGEKGPTQLTVNVARPAMDMLRAYATLHGITMTETLGRALGLLEFVAKQRLAGVKFLMEARNGSMRELVDP